MFDFARKFFLYLKNKLTRVKGAAMVELALTFPIVISLIFFLIEVLRMKDVRTAVDGMVSECSVQFMFSKSTTEGDFTFDKIIEKYRPGYVPKSDIAYYFTIFDSPEDLYKDGTAFSVYWPQSESSSQQSNGAGKKLTLKNYSKPELGLADSDSSKGFLNNKAFVLTFVVKYKFASSWLSKLFQSSIFHTDPSDAGTESNAGASSSGSQQPSGSAGQNTGTQTPGSDSAGQNTNTPSSESNGQNTNTQTPDSDSSGQNTNTSTPGTAGQNTGTQTPDSNTSPTVDISQGSFLMWSRGVGFCK